MHKITAYGALYTYCNNNREDAIPNMTKLLSATFKTGAILTPAGLKCYFEFRELQLVNGT